MRHLNSHPTAEINTKATHILFQQMGIVGTIRFLIQYTLGGGGDYTKERGAWLDDMPLEEIVTDIKARRK